MKDFPWMTVTQAAEKFDMDAETIRRRLRDGEVEGAFKHNDMWYIPKDAKFDRIPLVDSQSVIGLANHVAAQTGVTVGEAHKTLLSCIAVARMRERGQQVQLETRIANLEVARR